jgi:hypothetical protein
VTLGERRRQKRGSNDEDMMRLAKQLCTGTTGDLPYLIVASEKKDIQRKPGTMK